LEPSRFNYNGGFLTEIGGGFEASRVAESGEARLKKQLLALKHCTAPVALWQPSDGVVRLLFVPPSTWIGGVGGGGGVGDSDQASGEYRRS
jgi:hypothetical protein